MRVPVSWLRTLVPGLTATADEVYEALVRAGLEVETVERVGDDVSDVVVGEVLDVEELTGFKKPIRFCHVDVGDRTHEVVCGATQLRRRRPGRVRAARGRPARRLPHRDAPDVRPHVRRDDLLRRRARPVRRVRRHPGAAAGHPARRRRRRAAAAARRGARHRGDAGPRLRAVGPRRRPRGGDRLRPRSWPTPACATRPARRHRRPPGPGRGRERLRPLRRPRRRRARPDGGVAAVAAAAPAAGRHAADLAGRRRHQPRDARARPAAARLRPRRAAGRGRRPAARSRASGSPPSTARTGLSTPTTCSSPTTADRSRSPASWAAARPRSRRRTTRLLLESAHFERITIARTARRHKLPSEASKRYERGVDPALAAAAAEAAVQLLVELGGATAGPVTDVDTRAPAPGPLAAARRAGAAGRPAVRARGRPPPAGGRRLHRDRQRPARGRAALVAPRPDRPGRARRGGRAPGGLRHDPGRAAGRSRRSRADRRAAPAPRRVTGARRLRPGRGRARRRSSRTASSRRSAAG